MFVPLGCCRATARMLIERGSESKPNFPFNFIFSVCTHHQTFALVCSLLLFQKFCFTCDNCTQRYTYVHEKRANEHQEHEKSVGAEKIGYFTRTENDESTFVCLLLFVFFTSLYHSNNIFSHIYMLCTNILMMFMLPNQFQGLYRMCVYLCV